MPSPISFRHTFFLDGQAAELHPKHVCDGLEVRMVGDDHGNLEIRKLAALVANEEVVQAVVLKVWYDRWEGFSCHVPLLVL